MQSLAGQSPEATIALLLTFFGVAHSGLASLRPKMEEVIGARVRNCNCDCARLCYVCLCGGRDDRVGGTRGLPRPDA